MSPFSAFLSELQRLFNPFFMPPMEMAPPWQQQQLAPWQANPQLLAVPGAAWRRAPRVR